MKHLNPRTFVIFGLAGLLGVILLHTSQNVQNAEEKLAALESEIAREEEKIRMLQAEWVHLNRPERLERLAQEFLDLVPPTPEQLMGEGAGDAFPVRAVPEVSTERPAAQPISASEVLVKPALKPKLKAVAPKKPKPAPIAKPRGFDDLIGDLTSEGGAP